MYMHQNYMHTWLVLQPVAESLENVSAINTFERNRVFSPIGESTTLAVSYDNNPLRGLADLFTNFHAR